MTAPTASLPSASPLLLPPAQHLLKNQPAVHTRKLLVHLGAGGATLRFILLDLQVSQRIDPAVQELLQSLLQRHSCRAEVEERGELKREAELSQLLVGNQRARFLRLSEVQRWRQVEAQHLLRIILPN